MKGQNKIFNQALTDSFSFINQNQNNENRILKSEYEFLQNFKRCL